MLGIPDFSILAVYTLCVLAALACVVYGVFNWKKGANGVKPDLAEQWQQTEADIAEKLDI